MTSAKAPCPTHGAVTFAYNSICNWWECPEIESCDSVIPHGDVTPDGADVTSRDEVTSRPTAVREPRRTHTGPSGVPVLEPVRGAGGDTRAALT